MKPKKKLEQFLSGAVNEKKLNRSDIWTNENFRICYSEHIDPSIVENSGCWKLCDSRSRNEVINFTNLAKYYLTIIL
jgi:hypothetical protein